MDVDFDPAKRDATLMARGLDMARSGEVFSGATITIEDDREDYGEPRYVTFGLLSGRLVCIAWTPRGETRRVFSMRKCNDREQARYLRRLTP